MLPGTSQGIYHEAAWTKCGIYTAGRFSERGKFGGEESIHHMITEYGRSVHGYVDNYGALLMA